ncbi:RNA recognition motif domain-containing protein [Desulfonatronum thiodismutans]|jgi:RNA recognition motif-containing protein|uniref:RNA recognition motif domain-containing protein n=1 Tax=Desulfonatronum thiodismutans TaxID=159290 RepID=UPI0004ABE4CC|nr:RNA-binding protein [Desulfonatronum thiodismutans]
MDNKLYVGNLSYSTTEDDLHALFSDAGSVQSVAVIKDRDSGRSKGFGFVEMSSDDDAQKAIDLFHGTDYQGRPLTVNVARPREDRPRFDGGGGGKGRRSGGGGGRQRDW